eukprot:TRINITY_DN76300_c0_g1_i1.p1 TRINITY_DN76300_c0_g1~~TRINITY_DN76300_c0_g1_i1.p1  ORF type:complete len:201 (+),score=42.74 TRINITY_DN76300_c0_g1_i1:121-723(+)
MARRVGGFTAYAAAAASTGSGTCGDAPEAGRSDAAAVAISRSEAADSSPAAAGPGGDSSIAAAGRPAAGYPGAAVQSRSGPGAEAVLLAAGGGGRAATGVDDATVALSGEDSRAAARTVDVTVAHALRPGSGLQVVVPEDATFGLVRQAICREVDAGSCDLSRLRFVQKVNNVYVGVKDSLTIGASRHVLCLGADLPAVG